MLALVFPGQGSQQVGMGRDIFEMCQPSRQVFEAADDALGLKISDHCFNGPEEALRRTELQQPALLTTSIALLRALEEEAPVAAAYTCGHSLGEYSALVASGALEFADAVRLVHARGRFMQEATSEGQGAMAAILGCPPELIEESCRVVEQECGEVVSPANYNSPQQTVVAGMKKAVARVGELAMEQGAKRVVALAVSAPFHCRLMAPAAERLRPLLDATIFSAPVPPVVTNVEAEPNADPERISALLVRQVTAPVRFTEMVGRLTELGVTHFLEVGVGRVLSGLLARIQRRCWRANLGSAAELDSARKFVESVR